MRLAVIGGGWAGMAAAVEATAAGADVTLIEAGRVLGGRARTVSLDGRTLDNGQHILLGAYRDTLSLMRRVGADPDTLFDRRPLAIHDRSGFRMALPAWPAPLHLAWGLLSARPLGWREKLRTALWMQGIQHQGFRVVPDRSVGDWLDAAGQTGVLRRRLWEPLCLAALNTPADRASAQLFANVLRDSLGSPHAGDTDLLLPRCDFGQLLPQPASRWLSAHGAHLRFGQRVRSLSPGNETIHVDGEAFDAAILATAAQHACRLWPAMPRIDDHEPIATVYLEFGRKPALPFPLLNLDGRIGQWVVDRGNGLLACILSGHGAWNALDDDALLAALLGELGNFTGRQTPGWYKIVREQRATFSARPNLSRPGAGTGHPRLLLAGDYTWADYPATLEGAVRSGLRAARLALASLIIRVDHDHSSRDWRST